MRLRAHVTHLWKATASTILTNRTWLLISLFAVALLAWVGWSWAAEKDHKASELGVFIGTIFLGLATFGLFRRTANLAATTAELTEKTMQGVAQADQHHQEQLAPAVTMRNPSGRAAIIQDPI